MLFAQVKHIKLVALLSLFVGSIYAQSLQEADLLLQPGELLNSQNWGNGNDAYIDQVGGANEVELIQTQQGAPIGNLARVLQSGNWNVAVISQNENGNQLALIQRGDGNNYELINQGFGNQLVTIQDGADNHIVQHLIDSNQIQGELIQLGNGNEIISVLEGIQDSNYSIRQIGDGLKVIIRQSSF
ncbi:MAG: hypothetical protein R2830_17975 [Saprospiraceae bacterium]